MEKIPPATDAYPLEFDSLRPADDPEDECDRVFEDFIESITLSTEELALFVAMPEASVSEVRRMFTVPLYRGQSPYHA